MKGTFSKEHAYVVFSGDGTVEDFYIVKYDHRNLMAKITCFGSGYGVKLTQAMVHIILSVH